MTHGETVRDARALRGIRIALALALAIALSLSASVLAACSGSSGAVSIGVDASPPPFDATTGADATADATTDAGAADGAPPDAGPRDAAASADGGADASADADAGRDCAAILSAMFQAPIVPPSGWAGLDFAKGGQSDGGLGSGGLTIDEADVLACAAWVEPTVLEAGVAPSRPGYRTAVFAASPEAGADAGVVTVEYNLQSRVLWQAALGAGYTGELAFHSRAGGAYGTHTYAISIARPGATTSGSVLRDGVPFASDWTDSVNNAWANELYDGIMATFAPSVPAVADCATSTFTSALEGVPATTPDCLFQSNGYFGVRPLRVYLFFDTATDKVTTMWNFWGGALAAGCATPQADVEAMLYSDITVQGIAAGVVDVDLGGLPLGVAEANDGGLTFGETNTLLGCNGAAWTPPDPGYGGIAWGDGGLALEYNLDSGLSYKLYAQPGYEGMWTSGTPVGDAGDYYRVGIGALDVGTLDDAGAVTSWTHFAIDWTSQATADPAVTAIANAWYASNCGAPPDTDCVVQGDCTIVVDDGHGHSAFTLAPSSTMTAACGYTLAPFTVTFAQGSGAPAQLSTVNAAGE